MKTIGGRALEDLFKEYCLEQHQTSSGFALPPGNRFDPLTGEPININPFSGDFSFGGQDYTLEGPRCIDISEPVQLAGWSVVFFNSVTVDNTVLKWNANAENGTAILGITGSGNANECEISPAF